MIGEILGNRYKIIRELGTGGMAWVYLAKDLKDHQEVAVKVMYPQYSDDVSYVQRFTREAKLAIQLSSPHIVKVLNYGSDRDIHYLVMENVAGEDLKSVLQRRGPLPYQEVLGIAAQVARALHHANEHGIVHRDIKPENLMLDEHGTVKIVDMGIAGQLEGRRTLAQSEGVFGSPHYIAPEQAAGERIDFRVDLYSLGASAYRMLSGRTVFQGESQTEIMARHVNEDPVPLKRVAPWVPRRLCDVVMRMLEKDPDDRYQSAAEVLEALEGLGGDGTSGPRPSALRNVPGTELKPRLSRAARRRRNRMILVGVIAALVILVLLILILPG